ncbi:DUF3754 domain containing protein [Nitzschia inconspicua]|uniref:DUF3754 domain containing protein n=1 Tax=Nitzschia inconspicua TaxID=303405 RepID=A0A9K3LGI3_9STRA|nr:DUF3754 domain containing protein [Nitzschia inconspicua]
MTWNNKNWSKWIIVLVVMVLQGSLPFLLERNFAPFHAIISPSKLSITGAKHRPWISIRQASSSIDENITFTDSQPKIFRIDEKGKEPRTQEEREDVFSNIAQILSLDELPPAVRNATAAAVDLFREAPTPPVCRVVTRSGSKLPTDPSILPEELYQSPNCLLDKFGLYYHAQARRLTMNSCYLKGISNGRQIDQDNDELLQMMDKNTEIDLDKKNLPVTAQAEPVAAVLRKSLEDAGYELLSRRDIDLCDSLNAGYLLRLSILPDVSQLDPSIAFDFFPEKFHDNGTLRCSSEVDELLFEGRVLVFWRGYSQEITRGRLLLPKIDYLQASLVQRSAAWVKNKIDEFEAELFRMAMNQSWKLRQTTRRWSTRLIKRLRLRELVATIQKTISIVRQQNLDDDFVIPTIDGILGDDGDENEAETSSSSSNGPLDKRSGSIRLGRYGGSKIRFVGSPNPNDALEPFTICEYNYDDPTTDAHNATSTKPYKFKSIKNATVSLCEHDMYEEVNKNTYTCEYDARIFSEGKMDKKKLPRMQLLERVGISNLVDLFTKAGRREVLKAVFSKSRLVEPTYEEVVVVWRPLIKHTKKMTPPKIVSEFADMFDIQGFEQPTEEEVKIPPSKLEIRLFEQVPMSNLLAVLPKTKLVFRPADAFLFDMISVVTLVLVLSSVKFESSRLDVLAVVSVIFWLFRTVIRYSNKLARYDLLVKTFLTSKISQRNVGAFKYLTYEAALQRSIRSSLVLLWLSSRIRGETSAGLNRETLEQECTSEVNKFLKTEKQVQLDAIRAFQDLEDLQLLSFTASGIIEQNETILETSAETVKHLWSDLM